MEGFSGNVTAPNDRIAVLIAAQPSARKERVKKQSKINTSGSFSTETWSRILKKEASLNCVISEGNFAQKVGKYVYGQPRWVYIYGVSAVPFNIGNTLCLP